MIIIHLFLIKKLKKITIINFKKKKKKKIEKFK